MSPSGRPLAAAPLLLAIALWLAAGAAADAPRTAPAEGAAPGAELHRGVCWVGGRRPVTAADLRRLAEQHVGWISQTPFGWQRGLDSPDIVIAAQDRVWWGEGDRGLALTARLARDQGIRTLLKPHLWVTAPHGAWSGDIAMRDDASWRAWFRQYREFLLHYARLAAAEKMEALCIGTELERSVRVREADWRALISEVRALYPGKLTYAANWNREFEEVPFWDALDFIGIQAYFPLADGEAPGVEDLRRGWEPHLRAIERVQRAAGKPVLFTEIGYRSAPGAAARPWEWPERRGARAGAADLPTQARAYEAFFRTFWDRPWFAGAYFWKWYPDAADAGALAAVDFTPQNKPAQEVLAGWFGRDAARALHASPADPP